MCERRGGVEGLWDRGWGVDTQRGPSPSKGNEGRIYMRGYGVIIKGIVLKLSHTTYHNKYQVFLVYNFRVHNLNKYPTRGGFGKAPRSNRTLRRLCPPPPHTHTLKNRRYACLIEMDRPTGQYKLERPAKSMPA